MELRTTINNCLEKGISDLSEILLYCQSADPRTVELFLREELTNKNTKSLKLDKTLISTSDFSYKLPAPDPYLSQWWFSSSAVKQIISLINNRLNYLEKPEILCLGTPTIALGFSEDQNVTFIDIDNDLVSSLSNLRNTTLKTIQYNIYDDLPQNLIQKFDAVIIDPPWYDIDIKTMINKSLESLKIGGELFCTLPGKLARPGIEDFCSDLIKELVVNEQRIIALNQDSILYQVPHFENIALKNISGFRGIPWRKGDLIHIEKKSDKKLKVSDSKTLKFKSFSRKPNEFRVFINFKSSLSKGLPPQVIDSFSENISTRLIDKIPDLWTTSKVGLLISDLSIIEPILECWSIGKSKDETLNYLINKKGIEIDISNTSIQILEDNCKLWSKYSSPKILKDPIELIEESNKLLSVFGTSNSKRIIIENSDAYRPPFSRDRDRIIWSTSLKRLADKTQLFPSKEDDTVRRRLTHTLEVMQLASTIGNSLGLNQNLIEASALAHDLGHTPFGHAGEYAISRLLDSINKSFGGFNHYEHGLDVVSYLESPYQNDSKNAFFGLNLSLEILEAILKHTYFHDNNKFSSVQLQKSSKHNKNIPTGYCHLEGQAVRIADKVSYLISDIEDGLRIGAISIFDLKDCRLFHNVKLDFDSNSRENPLNQYLRQRKIIIKILMEDIIETSTNKISQANIKSIDSIRNASSYLISYSDEVGRDVGEVWNKLQVGLLFKNKKVITANLLAAKIVSELLILFTLIPNLVDDTFKNDHKKLLGSDYMNFYESLTGPYVELKKELHSFIPFHLMIGTDYLPYNDIEKVPFEDLVLAKDYVASLSDYRARYLHKLYLGEQN